MNKDLDKRVDELEKEIKSLKQEIISTNERITINKDKISNYHLTLSKMLDDELDKRKEKENGK